MRPFFIGLSISLGFSINPLVMAQHAGPQIQNAIHNFDFQKKDIESLINLLLMKDEISDHQATDALLRLGDLSEEEIKHLTMDAFQNFKGEEEISTLGQLDGDDTSFFFDASFGMDNFQEEESLPSPRSKTKKYQ